MWQTNCFKWNVFFCLFFACSNNRITFNLFTLESFTSPPTLHTLHNLFFNPRAKERGPFEMREWQAIINYALNKWWHKHDSFFLNGYVIIEKGRIHAHKTIHFIVFCLGITLGLCTNDVMKFEIKRGFCDRTQNIKLRKHWALSDSQSKQDSGIFNEAVFKICNSANTKKDDSEFRLKNSTRSVNWAQFEAFLEKLILWNRNHFSLNVHRIHEILLWIKSKSCHRTMHWEWLLNFLILIICNSNSEFD